jgi:hypothetical protein
MLTRYARGAGVSSSRRLAADLWVFNGKGRLQDGDAAIRSDFLGSKD